MKSFNHFSLILCSIFLLGATVEAKDLTHRLGIGFKNNTSQDLPSLALVYYPSASLGFTAGVGLDTKKDYGSFQAMAGGRYLVYAEPNMNFFTAAQAAVVSYENPIDGKKNGVEFAALFGVEFFLAGLENLGFTFEAGASLSTVNNTRIRTVGDDPFRAGLIFYF